MIASLLYNTASKAEIGMTAVAYYYTYFDPGCSE